VPTVRVLFPYLARWRALNWGRYQGLLGAVARAGHEVVVLEPPPVPGSREIGWRDAAEVRAPEGVRVEEVRMPGWWARRLPKLARKGAFALALLGPVAELAREADVVLLYNLPLLPAAALARRSFGGRPGVVAVDLADDLVGMLVREAGPWAEPFGRAALGRLVRAADVVTAASEPLAAAVGGRWLPNGVDLGEVRWRGGPPEPRSIGYLGALEYFVDLDLLEGVARSLPDHVLHVVGGGRREEEFRDRLGRLPNVRWHGAVPHREVWRHVGRWSVGLVPFRDGPVSAGSFPLKALEYLAAGAAVVGTPVPALGRLASEGLPVAVAGDVDGFAAAVRRLGDTPEPARRAARALVERRFSWDRIAAEWLRWIGGALGGAEARRGGAARHEKERDGEGDRDLSAAPARVGVGA